MAVPCGGITPDEVRALHGPNMRTFKKLLARGDVQVFDGPPECIDVDRYSHQTLVAGDSIARKAYAIGDEATRRRETNPIPTQLAEVARRVGDVLGLEIYGVGFVGQKQPMTVVDVNPFPSFRELPQVPMALWRHLESSLSR